MIRFWSICRNTFVQTIRQPIYGILILITFGILVLDVPLTGWTMSPTGEHRESDQLMLENLGLSTLLISGMLIAAFSASSVLSREIEDRTALTVIVKPVSRATFVLGKFVGVALAVTAGFYLCALAYLITVRHGVVSTASDPIDVPVIVLGLSALGLAILAAALGNLFFGWNFTSAGVMAGLVLLTVAGVLIGFIGKEWKLIAFGEGIRPDLLAGLCLILMAVTIFSAVAVAASTRLGQLMTLLICAAVLLVGYLHPFLFQELAGRMRFLRWVGWLMPNLRFFDTQDALATQKAIPASYVGLAGLYCAAYTLAALAVGVAVFQRRELEVQSTSVSMPGAVSVLAWIGRLGALLGILLGLVGLIQWRSLTAAKAGRCGLFILAGAAGWLVWEHFSRAKRWAYWVVALAASGALALAVASLLLPAAAEALRLGSKPAGQVGAAALAAFVLLILLLPRTRHHFKSD